MAIAIVSCASAESAPCDIAPPEKRRTIESTGSTSARGTGSTASDRLEQVTRLERRASVDELGEALVEVEALALDGFHERVRGDDAPPERLHHLRIGRVGLAALAELVEARVLELRLGRLARGEPSQRLALEPIEADPADRRRRAAEEAATEPPVEPDGLEQAGAAIAGDVGDAHLRHDLQDAVLEGVEKPPLRLCGRRPVAADLVDRREVGDGLQREPWADDVRAVAHEGGDHVAVPGLVARDEERAAESETAFDEPAVGCSDCEQCRNRRATACRLPDR